MRISDWSSDVCSSDLQNRRVEPRGERPIEAVAPVAIVGPFAVTVQISAADLDLDDGDLALCVDRGQVGAPPVRQRHLGNRDQPRLREQPAHAARDIGGGQQVTRHGSEPQKGTSSSRSSSKGERLPPLEPPPPWFQPPPALPPEPRSEEHT